MGSHDVNGCDRKGVILLSELCGRVESKVKLNVSKVSNW